MSLKGTKMPTVSGKENLRQLSFRRKICCRINLKLLPSQLVALFVINLPTHEYVLPQHCGSVLVEGYDVEGI